MSDTATITDARLSFVRAKPFDPLPPPLIHSGAIGWLRQNLFSSVTNILLTVCCALMIAWLAPPLIKFLLIDAVWDGSSRADCVATPTRPEVGACWAFVIERLGFFIYGFYPIEERWRVDVFFALLAFGIGWMTWLDAPRRDLGVIYFFVVMPVLSFFLLIGLPAIGLPEVTPRNGAACWSPSWWPRSASWCRCRSASCWRSAGARKCQWCGSPASSSSNSCAACR